MEESAIKAGFASLKDGREYEHLYSSALCRAKADWIIGINATRLFSCLYGKTLNVGRVQTPTLKMLVDRDAAITTFKKEKYYHVRLMLSGAEAVSERFSNRSEADTLKTACEAAQAVCVSMTREKEKPPHPRSSLTLPVYSGKQTAFSVIRQNRPLTLHKPCMKKKLLTYPRTDSAYLTDDMGDTAAGNYQSCFAKKFSFMADAAFSPEIRKLLNSKKGIRPPCNHTHNGACKDRPCRTSRKVKRKYP